MKELNRTETEAILQEGVDFSVTVAKPNILQRLRIISSVKKYKIYPIVLAPLMKISETINEIDPRFTQEPEKDKDVAFLVDDNIIQNKNRLVKIIAYGIENTGKSPSKKLMKFLGQNLTSKECLQLVMLIRRLMGNDYFFASTISLKGMVLNKKK